MAKTLYGVQCNACGYTAFTSNPASTQAKALGLASQNAEEVRIKSDCPYCHSGTMVATTVTGT